MSNKTIFLLSFLAGALYAFGFPNFLTESFLITPIISLTGLFYYFYKEKKLKSKFLVLMCFNVGFTLTGYYWIADTLQEFGKLPYILALLLNALFAFIITPYLWISLFFFHKKKNLNIDSGLKAFSLAVLFSLIEYYTPQQFDSFLGSPWIVFSQQLGFAPISGVIAYSFFSFLVIFELIRFFSSRKYSKINLFLILSFIILNPLIVKDQSRDNSKELNIRLVQANISNYLKVDSETGSTASSAQVINAYKELSLRPYFPGKKLDLIIWPETAYPFSVFTNQKNLQDTILPQEFIEVVTTMDADLFTGGYDSKTEYASFKSDYNTAFHISKRGQLLNTYHKHILIPFGETLPFGPLNEYLSQFITNISYFDNGTRFSLFNFNNGVKAISTICYEILKPEFFRDYLNNLSVAPNVMINLTNDSWYGKTMEPFQHLFLSRWRAVEFQLPIIRSTNTGITSVIYPDGTESTRTKLFNAENLDISLKLAPREASLFQKYGIATIFPIWIIGLIFHLLGVKLRNE